MGAIPFYDTPMQPTFSFQRFGMRPNCGMPLLHQMMPEPYGNEMPPNGGIGPPNHLGMIFFYLQDKSSFMQCIMTEEGSLVLQKELKTSSEVKGRIVELFNYLNMEEIVELSNNLSGNYFIIKFIKYVGGESVVIDNFMAELIQRPKLIQKIGNGKVSFKVIISLIATCKPRSKNYDKFINTLDQNKMKINPWIIQHLIKHNPDLKISLLQQIKNNGTMMSKAHLPFLGMYSWEEIGDFLTKSNMVKEKLKKFIQTKDWNDIYQETINSDPEFLLFQDLEIQSLKSRRRDRKMKLQSN